MIKPSRFGNARKLLTGALLATNLIGCIERAPIGQETVGDTTYTAWEHNGRKTVTIEDATGDYVRWHGEAPKTLQLVAKEDHPFESYSLEELEDTFETLKEGRNSYYPTGRFEVAGQTNTMHILPHKGKNIVVEKITFENQKPLLRIFGVIPKNEDAWDVLGDTRAIPAIYATSEYLRLQEEGMTQPEAFRRTAEIHHQTWLPLIAFRTNEADEICAYVTENLGGEGYCSMFGLKDSIARE